MKTIQMTLDEDLLKAVDQAVTRLHTSRSEFTRRALRQALESLRTESLERQHRRGYENHPVQTGEFDVWEAEHIWENE